MTDLPGYAPSQEHELLRQTVRDVADAKIAPAAADVDASSRFPQEALDALTGASLHAVHIPESYGGEGADALAAVIVIEEVARACASSSLIPAVTTRRPRRSSWPAARKARRNPSWRGCGTSPNGTALRPPPRWPR